MSQLYVIHMKVKYEIATTTEKQRGNNMGPFRKLFVKRLLAQVQFCIKKCQISSNIHSLNKI